ncbi:MAG: dihydrofolate reductase family protein, partial [Candidatus Limnocylindria bacterium]
MRRVVVEEFLTVDGIMEAPGFDEHRSGRNAWALRIQDDESLQYNRERYFGVDALLMGRVTYQIWAAFWPTAGGEEAFTRRINEMPKYVVSRTLKAGEWTNSTVLRGEVGPEVHNLKKGPGGDILVPGSADLVNELMRLELVDEYRLLVFPLILGSGKHLFEDEIETHHLHLVNSRAFGSGVVLLTYQPGEPAPASPYVDEFAWTQEQVQSLQAAQDTTRVLATVLFTDIVDSTGRAAQLGDRAWRQLLDRHDEAARKEVDRWHGQFVKSTGDG